MGIDSFVGNFRFGISSPARYEVILTNPVSGFADAVSMMCEESELPGRGLATTPLQMFGQSIKLPYQALYSDLTLGFICSDDMYEKRFFDKWMRYILDDDNHYVEYLDKYKADIVINKLDALDRIVYTATFEEAFPITIGAVSLGYAQANTYSKVPITFAYTKWRFEDTDQGDGSVRITVPGIPGGEGGDLPSAPDDVKPI